MLGPKPLPLLCFFPPLLERAPAPHDTHTRPLWPQSRAIPIPSPCPAPDPPFLPPAEPMQGAPLWCEYLLPWVLRKEFHTILAVYGVQYLCSERFRQGLGPAEDVNDRTGGG